MNLHSAFPSPHPAFKEVALVENRMLFLLEYVLASMILQLATFLQCSQDSVFNQISYY